MSCHCLSALDACQTGMLATANRELIGSPSPLKKKTKNQKKPNLTAGVRKGLEDFPASLQYRFSCSLINCSLPLYLWSPARQILSVDVSY